MKDEKELTVYGWAVLSLNPSSLQFGQTPDLPATHARVATVAPFPAWRGSPALRCAEPEV